MNKPKIGHAVTVGYRQGKVIDITVNNGNTLYIVQTDTDRVAVTLAGLAKSNELLSNKELNKIDRAADSRKPLIHDLLLALNNEKDPIWYEAKCRGDYDPEAWWLDWNIDDNDLPRLARALTICSECPVKAECYTVGSTQSEIMTGIWGGLLPGERIIKAYGAPRRTQAQRVKMDIATKVRRRVNDFIHKQMRDKVMVLWSAK